MSGLGEPVGAHVPRSRQLRVVSEVAMSFVARLKEAQKKAQERTGSWQLRLEGLKGKIWDDGIERISTQTVFDILEVPHGWRLPQVSEADV